MDLITVDFETYYDKDFSLSKLTTEEYIRSELFEVIGVSVKVNHEPTEWASGTHDELRAYLETFNWSNSMMLAHNNVFDAAILNWVFGIRAKAYACTLCIARAYHGVNAGGSLAKLAIQYGLGEKGTEIINALGKRRADFSTEELSKYGDYCINDTEICYKLFEQLCADFPKKELRVIDVTIRMFVEPILELDSTALGKHMVDVLAEKDALMETLAGQNIDRKQLMSNKKFAELLIEQGVVPPTKISKTTEKETYAFAKTDEEFVRLLEHEGVIVQALAAARLGIKSTIEETRTQRFIEIAARGALPVPIKYYAAHTGRFGGFDKINLQNLANRGVHGKKLKCAIHAPAGMSVVDGDSSQIEARVLAWMAGQEDLLKAFAAGEDVYSQMAAQIYGIPVDKVTPAQRFVGKVTILGAGYGMGAERFLSQLKNFGVTDIDLDEARRIIAVYRNVNYKIKDFWKQCKQAIDYMLANTSVSMGALNQIDTIAPLNAVKLPSGLLMYYPDLELDPVVDSKTYAEIVYKQRSGKTRLYGGKMTENICQGIARCVITDQMLLINKKYRPVLTVHDSIACVVPDAEVDEAKAYVTQCMQHVPDWAQGLPLACEVGSGKSYGDC